MKRMKLSIKTIKIMANKKEIKDENKIKTNELLQF
jgi:hypothetical protein